MEAVRVAAEEAHKQHMEALRQLEETRTGTCLRPRATTYGQGVELGGLSEAPPSEL